MAWVCDLCGGPADAYSGGQGQREICSKCEADYPPVPTRQVAIYLTVSADLARDADEATLARILGEAAVEQVKALVAKDDTRVS